jgi:hypothetical protein
MNVRIRAMSYFALGLYKTGKNSIVADGCASMHWSWEGKQCAFHLMMQQSLRKQKHVLVLRGETICSLSHDATGDDTLSVFSGEKNVSRLTVL